MHKSDDRFGSVCFSPNGKQSQNKCFRTTLLAKGRCIKLLKESTVFQYITPASWKKQEQQGEPFFDNLRIDGYEYFHNDQNGTEQDQQYQSQPGLASDEHNQPNEPLFSQDEQTFQDFSQQIGFDYQLQQNKENKGLVVKQEEQCENEPSNNSLYNQKGRTDFTEEGSFRVKREDQQVKLQVPGLRDSRQPQKGKAPRRGKRKAVDHQFLQQAKAFFEVYNAAEHEGRLKPKLCLRRYAEEKGYGHSTIYELYKEWLNDPTMMKHENKLNQNSLCSLRGNGRVTNQRKTLVLQMLKKNPFLEQREVMEALEGMEGLEKKFYNGEERNLNRQTLCRLYRLIGLRRLRLNLISTKRNQPEDISARKVYARALVRCLQEGYQVCFIDEMTVNRFVSRDRVWGLEGQVFTNAMINLKRESLLILAVMNGFGGIECEFVQGGAQQVKYEAVVERLVEEAFGGSQVERKLMVLHYAVGERAKRAFVTAAERRGFKILQIPPLSSPLNPLEYLFIQIRNSLRSVKFESDFELVQATTKIVREKMGNNFMPNLNKYIEPTLEKCLLGKPI